MDNKKNQNKKKSFQKVGNRNSEIFNKGSKLNNEKGNILLNILYWFVPFFDDWRKIPRKGKKKKKKSDKKKKTNKHGDFWLCEASGFFFFSYYLCIINSVQKLINIRTLIDWLILIDFFEPNIYKFLLSFSCCFIFLVSFIFWMWLIIFFFYFFFWVGYYWELI